MRWALGVVLVCGLAGSADAAVEKSDIFVAGEDGHASYRIPGIVRTADGTLLAFAEARTKTGGDYDDIDIVLRRSKDGGNTWGPMETLVDLGTTTVNNPLMIVDRRQPGVVHFLYCQDYAHAFYRRSADNGRTFSPPVEITKTFAAFQPEFAWKLLATGPGHSIQLDSGRLLVPIWLSPRKEQFPSAIGTITSDDGGATWRAGDIVVRSGDPPNHPMEGVVAQLSDGRVMMNIRNEGNEHLRAVAFSSDGATHWTKPVFDAELNEPCCEGSLLAVPPEIAGAKGVLLFANPNNTRRNVDLGPAHYRDRKNVTLRMSRDDGKTWAASLVIEPGFSGYTDLAVAPDGTVFCLYERGAGGNDGTYYYLPQAVTLARLKLDDLRAPPAEGPQ